MVQQLLCEGDLAVSCSESSCKQGVHMRCLIDYSLDILCTVSMHMLRCHHQPTPHLLCPNMECVHMAALVNTTGRKIRSDMP